MSRKGSRKKLSIIPHRSGRSPTAAAQPRFDLVTTTEQKLISCPPPRHLLGKILTAHAATKQDQPPLSIHYPPVVSGGNEPEFVFVGKAMAHRTDRGCELVPIALSLAHLPEGLNLEVKIYMLACPRSCCRTACVAGGAGGGLILDLEVQPRQRRSLRYDSCWRVLYRSAFARFSAICSATIPTV